MHLTARALGKGLRPCTGLYSLDFRPFRPCPHVQSGLEKASERFRERVLDDLCWVFGFSVYVRGTSNGYSNLQYQWAGDPRPSAQLYRPSLAPVRGRGTSELQPLAAWAHERHRFSCSFRGGRPPALRSKVTPIWCRRRSTRRCPALRRRSAPSRAAL